MMELKSQISWTSSSRPSAIGLRAMTWAANSKARDGKFGLGAAADIVETGNGYFLSCRAEVGREGWWPNFLQGQ